MHISKIELENIKSHAAAKYEFTRGTTAITGENGAGKTTIIEAVAWVLFDLLEYKKDDFVRRGEKKGFVRITFESGLDERDYVVYRDTGSGYYVTDPRLDIRIADKKEEVFRFLWLHLGLEPGTDLRSLFRQAIGVPQGMFTAIFLEGATERKIAFDRLLKVEEYRQAAEKLRETVRFIENSIGDVREKIARAEGELSRSPLVEAEHRTVSKSSQAIAAEATALAADLVEKNELVELLDAEEHRLAALRAAADKSRAKKEKEEIIGRQSEAAYLRAKNAAAKVAETRSDNDRHIASLNGLGGLESDRRLRDQLLAERSKIEAASIKTNVEQQRITAEIRRIRDAKTEIEILSTKVAEQISLETQLNDLRDRIAEARVAAERIQSIDRELVGLRDQYRANMDVLKTARAQVQGSPTLSELESEEVELIKTLAILKTTLERDQKFQSEIRDGLCPILSQKCLNLDPNESLDEFLTNQFHDARTQIANVEDRCAAIREQILIQRTANDARSNLEFLENREKEIRTTADEKTKKQAVFTEQQHQLGDLEKRFVAAEAQLKSLADPAARIRWLELETAKESKLTSELAAVQSKLDQIEDEKRRIDAQLLQYQNFDETWTKFSVERDATLAAHRVFVANESEARMIDTRKAELDESINRIDAVSKEALGAEELLNSSGGNYDPEQHRLARADLLRSQQTSAEKLATLEATDRRKEQLAAELAHFTEVRTTLSKEFKEKERLENVAATTGFIRDTLKEAAPRVARNYVYHVSIEANQIYREIIGSAERTLKWTEDYSVMLEEDGYERPFSSLSGGEQMAAALAIRLALLKQLTDIRIAFFDEPTTNMDAERRENLAQQISRISHFDQLFVISHDETFDSYVDNVINIAN